MVRSLLLVACLVITSTAHAQQPPSKIIVAVNPGEPTLLNINGLQLEIRVVGTPTEPNPPSPNLTAAEQASHDFANNVRVGLALSFAEVRQKMNDDYTKDQLNQWLHTAMSDSWSSARAGFITRSAELSKDTTKDQRRQLVTEFVRGFQK